MNSEKQNYVLMDEHWLMFEPLHSYEWHKELRAEADRLSSLIKGAITNRLEIDKIETGGV